jgi:hypothetical protein
MAKTVWHRFRVGDKVRQALTGAGILVALLLTAGSSESGFAQQKGGSMELSRPVRTWEFLSATGQKAALFGNEAGRMEAWVYPLKLFRNFHVIFHSEGVAIPAEALARSITVRPESSNILYAGDAFAVRERFLVPVNESGAVILFEVDTEEPLEIEVAFQRDFQLEWPAAIGGTYMDALPDGRRFFFGEESKRFAGLIGSPSAAGLHEEYQTNYSESQESSFRLGCTA